MPTDAQNTTANKQVGGVKFKIGSDPRNTASIEEQAIRDVQRRFKRLRGAVRNTVGYENDALGLTANQEVEEQEDFDAKDAGTTLLIAELIRWLKEQVNTILGLLLSPVDVQQGAHFLAGYLQEAVQTGANQATGLLYQEGINVDNIPTDEILQTPVYSRVLTSSTGRFTKAFNALKNVRDDLSDNVEQIVRDGLRAGWTPRKMADELTREIRTMERTRAVQIARTEIAAAHTEAALQTYERGGVDTVGHVGRVTAQDQNVCAWCRRISTEAFTIDEFRDVVVEWLGKVYRVGIPAHTNGRCLPVPLPGVEELDPLEERVPGTIINR